MAFPTKIEDASYFRLMRDSIVRPLLADNEFYIIISPGSSKGTVDVEITPIGNQEKTKKFSMNAADAFNAIFSLSPLNRNDFVKRIRDRNESLLVQMPKRIIESAKKGETISDYSTINAYFFDTEGKQTLLLSFRSDSLFLAPDPIKKAMATRY